MIPSGQEPDMIRHYEGDGEVAIISSHLISEPLMVQINSYRPAVIGVDWPIASGLGRQVCDGDNSRSSGALTWQLAATID